MSVLLKCVKVGSKLRVRIISPNYYNDHNCQFPRSIRIENALYEVPASDVTLITSITMEHYISFYRIKPHNIRIVTNETHTLTRDLKVFQDEGEDDCVICLSNRKQYVFGPCGHFYVCKSCVDQLNQCPICRSKICFKADFQTLQN